MQNGESNDYSWLRNAAIKAIKNNEGFSSKVYKDTKGILTIGYGRNLESRGISESEAETMLSNDVQYAYETAMTLPMFTRLSSVWKVVYLDLLHNLGQTKLNKFKKLHEALNAGNYFEALIELIDSNWYFEVGYRSKRAVCALYNVNVDWLYEEDIRKIDGEIYRIIPLMICGIQNNKNREIPSRLFKANTDAYEHEKRYHTEACR